MDPVSERLDSGRIVGGDGSTIALVGADDPDLIVAGRCQDEGRTQDAVLVAHQYCPGLG